MDEITARILGHLIGDGGVSARYYRMYYTNSNEKLIKEYCSLLKRRKIPFFVYTHKTVKTVVTYRKKYALEFLSYGGCEAKNKYISASVLNSKRSIRICVLDSILKDEGRRVSVDRVQFATTKEKFMSTLLKLIKSLGIEVKKTYCYKREKYTQYIVTLSLSDLKKYGIHYWEKMPLPEKRSSILSV
jgi:intein/homing endonuclease